MKIIILGAGQVGYNIARYLANEENDVTVVDQSAELLRKISDSLDVQPICGYASFPEVLDKAGASQADLLIAVTGSDEVNIVACEVANSLFKIETKVARIRSQNYLNPYWSELFSPYRLAIDVVISPEIEIAKAINQSIRIRGAYDVIPITGSLTKVVGVHCISPSAIINTPLRLLPTTLPHIDIAIGCITRGSKTFIATPDDQLMAGDDVYFLAHIDHIPAIMAAFGYHSLESRHCLIIGAGNIGLMLAHEIESHQSTMITKLIERRPQRAELAARQLKRGEVLCGDGLDLEVLNEANVSHTETIVCVTEDDKVNILSALLAKRQGVNRALVLLNNMEYAPLVTSLGVDAVISPKAITVSTILHHIRQGSIRSIRSLRDGFAEIIEADVQESSNVVGLSVQDIQIQGSILVMALTREDKAFILPRSQIIRSNDRLVILVKQDAIKKIEKLFLCRTSYL
ncbi:MAG: Trk system potassium transporter TrkA [Proteobacteria bacterium]|nr:Trk system potassium transporter TrkA [Pseudomonadota bacterium]